MNIFVLDNDPKLASSYHTNAHVIKMILETTQLLSTAIPYLIPGSIGCYKPTHINHPCSKWTRQSFGNYDWLWNLGISLCSEYTKRYEKVHACQKYLHNILKIENSLIINSPMTPFAQAMPDQYKNKNAVIAYRNYYMGDKRHIAKWKTETPFWWK